MIDAFSRILFSDKPDGLRISSSNASYSASSACLALRAADAFSPCAIAIVFLSSWALIMLVMLASPPVNRGYGEPIVIRRAAAAIPSDHYVHRHHKDTHVRCLRRYLYSAF